MAEWPPNARHRPSHRRTRQRAVARAAVLSGAAPDRGVDACSPQGRCAVSDGTRVFHHYVVHQRQTVRKCGGWLGWWSPEWAVIVGGSGDRMGVEPRWVGCRLAGSCGGGCGGGCESLPNALANRSRLNPCRSFRLSTGCVLRLVGTTAVSAHRSSRRSDARWWLAVDIALREQSWAARWSCLLPTALADGEIDLLRLVVAGCHHNGWIREGAVVHLSGQRHPAAVAVLALRTCDWVPQVRERVCGAGEYWLPPGGPRLVTAAAMAGRGDPGVASSRADPPSGTAPVAV